MDQPPAAAFTAFADTWPRAVETEIGTALCAIGAGKTFLTYVSPKIEVYQKMLTNLYKPLLWVLLFSLGDFMVCWVTLVLIVSSSFIANQTIDFKLDLVEFLLICLCKVLPGSTVFFISEASGVGETKIVRLVIKVHQVHNRFLYFVACSQHYVSIVDF